MVTRTPYLTPADVEANGWASPPRRFLMGHSGYYDPTRAHLRLCRQPTAAPWQAKLLTWLRDSVHPSIPRKYYGLVLGHDLHLAVWAELYVRHFHAEPHINTIGWWEDVGRVSQAKVTTAFRDFEAANLVAEQVSYGDFKFHEAGTSAAAEANTQTGLTTTTGIARVAGNQTNPSLFTYQTVAVVTADTAETWQEHGIFNQASGGVMMDRSLITPTVSVQPGDSVEFTYILTKSAEP